MDKLEKAAEKMATWIGSPISIVTHTFVFVVTFLTYYFGVPLATILLVLTTIVSLEAIYLSIFVQMTVNKHTGNIAEIHKHLKKDDIAIASKKSKIMKAKKVVKKPLK